MIWNVKSLTRVAWRWQKWRIKEIVKGLRLIKMQQGTVVKGNCASLCHVSGNQQSPIPCTNWQEVQGSWLCTRCTLMESAHAALPAWLVSLSTLNWQRSEDGAAFINMTGVWGASLCSLIIWQLSYPVHELVIWSLRYGG